MILKTYLDDIKQTNLCFKMHHAVARLEINIDENKYYHMIDDICCTQDNVIYSVDLAKKENMV